MKRRLFCLSSVLAMLPFRAMGSDKQSESNGKWISTEERLPELIDPSEDDTRVVYGNKNLQSDRVLVVCAGVVELARLYRIVDEDYLCWIEGDGLAKRAKACVMKCQYVTHWMELPEYKGE